MSGGSRETLTARTSFVATAVALMTAAFMLAKTGRDALYFQGRGVLDLPAAYVGIALLALPVAAATLGTMRALGPRRTRVVAPIAMSAALFVYRAVAEPGGGFLMTACFMLIPLVFGVLFSMTWLLAAELLDRAENRTLASAYAAIGASSIGGGTAGAFVARLCAMHVQPTDLLLFSAIALIASSAVVALAQRRYPERPLANTTLEKPKPELRAVPELLKEGYARSMLLIAALGSLAAIFVEFQFYLAAAAAGQGGQENVSFFASFYLILNGSALLIQLLAMPPIQRRIGVHGSLLVLPCALAAAVTSVFASTSITTRSLLRIAEGGLKSSIHRANWEQAYLGIAHPRRGLAKLAVDGMGARIAEGVAAGLLLVWLEGVVGDASIVGQDVRWITYALGVTLVTWVVATEAFRRRTRGLVAPSETDGRPDVPLPDT